MVYGFLFVLWIDIHIGDRFPCHVHAARVSSALEEEHWTVTENCKTMVKMGESQLSLSRVPFLAVKHHTKRETRTNLLPLLLWSTKAPLKILGKESHLRQYIGHLPPASWLILFQKTKFPLIQKRQKHVDQGGGPIEQGYKMIIEHRFHLSLQSILCPKKYDTPLRIALSFT